ncbi:MAG: transglycosylase SLT domain-containing protein [Thermocrinis sp.]|jgi:hypothetical protein|nr:transglycosylase SLT domain-containing protein [Thermocrinis sp.]
MERKLLTLAILGISLGVSLKVFIDKADEAASNAYQQGQMYLAEVNIDKLKLLQEVRCDGLDLGTYFQQKAKEKGFEPYVAAIIPQESSGKVYATGCDKCPENPILKAARHNTNSTNWQWLKAVFNTGLHSLCLRKNATIENTCTVGFGLMQITSHTISEPKYLWRVYPEALYQTKAKEVSAGNYSAVKDEPPNSPYNPCTNIEVGLSILRDKYNICRKKYGESVKTMACAVCYYNGRTDYLAHIRSTVIDRGQAGLLVRVGFIKDGLLEGLRKFVIGIESFVKGWDEEKLREIQCIKVF